MEDKRNFCPNVPVGAGGVGGPPLTFCFHIFWVQNYLFLHPCQHSKTIPVYLTSKSGSNLSNTPLILIGYAPCVDPIAPLDANLVPSNSGSSYTESDVVENLSIRLARHSIFSLQMDWCGPSGPRTSYMTPVQSDAMIPISRNSHSDIQMFYQNSRLPNYSLDTFSGRLFDVVSSKTFTTGDVQTELHHAITRSIVFVYLSESWFFLSKYTVS